MRLVNIADNNDVIDIGAAEKYTDNLCGQCWNCANRVGYGIASMTLKSGEKTYVKLPQCKKTDKYMTEVYSMPCDYFKEQ